MATLHVRNVPDELYDRLRAQATANGRSIGAEAVTLLSAQIAAGTSTAVGARRLHRMERRRTSPGKTPFEHFSPRARQVVVDAQDEARELGHAFIGTEHLLLGVLRERTTVAARVCEVVGLEYDQVRDAIEQLHGRGEGLPTEPIPFSPSAKKALELALRESLDMSDPFIGPEHVLLGIAREAESSGAAILADRGQDGDSLRRTVTGFAVRGGGSFELLQAVRVIELGRIAGGVGAAVERRRRARVPARPGRRRPGDLQAALTAASIAARRLRRSRAAPPGPPRPPAPRASRRRRRPRARRRRRRCSGVEMPKPA